MTKLSQTTWRIHKSKSPDSEKTMPETKTLELPLNRECRSPELEMPLKGEHRRPEIELLGS